jgi:hypothetical protein
MRHSSLGIPAGCRGGLPGRKAVPNILIVDSTYTKDVMYKHRVCGINPQNSCLEELFWCWCRSLSGDQYMASSRYPIRNIRSSPAGFSRIYCNAIEYFYAEIKVVKFTLPVVRTARPPAAKPHKNRDKL